MKKILLNSAGVLLLLTLCISLFVDNKDTTNLADKELPSSKKMWLKDKGAKPTGYIQYMNEISKGSDSRVSEYKANYRFDALSKAKKQVVSRGNRKTDTGYEAISRGPGNVGGRTRAIVVDPDDASLNTWFAGAAGGGIWKTTDAGGTWANISEDLPNLGTNALAMSASNHDVMYVGTGEVFGGNLSFVRGDGMFKTLDRGATWTHLSSTANASFVSVNGIVIDPASEDIVVVCTNTGVYKTLDGGTTWTETHKSNSSVQDIEVNPNDFSEQYVGIFGDGVYKSTDSGDSWSSSSNGLADVARIELAISTKVTEVIYACTYDGDDNTLVYKSVNSGTDWVQFADAEGDNANFLGEQGWYDNTLAVNPYDENEVFLGGVYVGKYLFDGEITSSEPAFIGVDQENTASFLAFVNFGQTAFGGALALGDGDDASEEFVNVEIRFGPEQSQKAHRFTVPSDGGSNGDGGAGVGDADYTYADYIDVPFEVWDTDNDQQLMVSFRDQQNNGEFNLNPRNDDTDPDLLLAREYVFISNEVYSETASSTIGVSGGGHLAKNMYFFWPIASAADAWQADQLPESVLRLKYGSIQIQSGESTIVSDPRGDFGGNNSNLHADHHHLTLIGMDDDAKTIRIINGNDGGLGLSENGGVTWTQILDGYITTQFYDAAKKPGADEYFGGMQDNGTWQSPFDASASASSNYNEQLGGDGFEVLWHATDPDKLMGSLYNNRISRSLNGGNTWGVAQSGINTSDTESPFITRLASSDSNPDAVFAVSALGVYKTTDFGGNWSLIPIAAADGWTVLSGDPAEPFPLSTLRVDVSNADHNIVWGGSGMDDDQSVFVSTDGGDTFTATVNYDGGSLGSFSGLGTHPTEPNTAYALFGLADGPKILRTKDLGQTWEDITGFGANAESDNGFPNVIVHSILVLPHEPTTIFAGTEIGLFESTDDGASWHLANHGIPNVSIWSMEVRDNQVVFGTFGRGIWTLTIDALLNSQAAIVTGEYLGDQTAKLGLNLPVDFSTLSIYLDDQLVETVSSPRDELVLNSVTDLYSYELAVSPSETLERVVRIVTGIDGNEYTSANINFDADFNPSIISFSVNASDELLLDAKFDITESYDSFDIYLNDEVVETQTDIQIGDLSTSLTVTSPGEYVVKAVGHLGSLSFSSDEQMVVVTVVAGINDLSNQWFDVHPNPVSEILSFKLLPSMEQSGYDLSVFNINGKLISSEARGISSLSNTLDVSSFDNGVYVLRLESADAIRISKFVKK